MALKVARFLALLCTGLALTMTSAHVLELPPKMHYDPALYAAVNGTLYRYFAVVGGAYTVASVVSATVLAWLVRRRHPSFEWAVLGAALLLLGFVSWLAVVEPVNMQVSRTLSSSAERVPSLWTALRDRWEYGHLAGFVFQLGGFAAIVMSTVVETTAAVPEVGLVHTSAATLIHAPWERVVAIYADYPAWPRVFGRTIKGARLVREDGLTQTLAIDHVEGQVLNVMSRVAPQEILLEEWKKLYDARFVNRFEAVPEGTRYSIVADVTLKGALKALAPIAKPIIRARMRKLVLDPVKYAAERASA